MSKQQTDDLQILMESLDRNAITQSYIGDHSFGGRWHKFARVDREELATSILNNYTPNEEVEARCLEIEKAYGGCHNCYGKGYATRQAFVNGRYQYPQDPMVFCNCERGKRLETLLKQRGDNTP